MNIVVSRNVVNRGFEVRQNGLCLQPARLVFAYVTGNDYGVYAPLIDHLNGGIQVGCGVRGMGTAQVHITDLRDYGLSRYRPLR
jgi:hypothetical protein